MCIEIWMVLTSFPMHLYVCPLVRKYVNMMRFAKCLSLKPFNIYRGLFNNSSAHFFQKTASSDGETRLYIHLTTSPCWHIFTITLKLICLWRLKCSITLFPLQIKNSFDCRFETEYLKIWSVVWYFATSSIATLYFNSSYIGLDTTSTLTEKIFVLECFDRFIFTHIS